MTGTAESGVRRTISPSTATRSIAPAEESLDLFTEASRTVNRNAVPDIPNFVPLSQQRPRMQTSPLFLEPAIPIPRFAHMGFALVKRARPSVRHFEAAVVARCSSCEPLGDTTVTTARTNAMVYI